MSNVHVGGTMVIGDFVIDEGDEPGTVEIAVVRGLTTTTWMTLRQEDGEVTFTCRPHMSREAERARREAEAARRRAKQKVA